VCSCVRFLAWVIFWLTPFNWEMIFFGTFLKIYGTFATESGKSGFDWKSSPTFWQYDIQSAELVTCQFYLPLFDTRLPLFDFFLVISSTWGCFCKWINTWRGRKAWLFSIFFASDQACSNVEPHLDRTELPYYIAQYDEDTQKFYYRTATNRGRRMIKALHSKISDLSGRLSSSEKRDW